MDCAAIPCARDDHRISERIGLRSAGTESSTFGSRPCECRHPHERGNKDRIAAPRPSKDTADEGQDRKVQHKDDPERATPSPVAAPRRRVWAFTLRHQSPFHCVMHAAHEAPEHMACVSQRAGANNGRTGGGSLVFGTGVGQGCASPKNSGYRERGRTSEVTVTHSEPREEPVTRPSLREYAAVQRERYLTATRAEKGALLDEVVAVTGLHRKAAIRLLRRPPRAPTARSRAGRPRRYGRRWPRRSRSYGRPPAEGGAGGGLELARL